MVAVAQVEIALQPWLGARLSRELFPLMEWIAGKMNAYTGAASPDALAAGIDSALFQEVRRVTRGTMLAQLPDDTLVRIRVEDFAVMTDDLMYLLFSSFPADESHFRLLQDYSMRVSSLAALRALYTRFAAMQTPEELRVLAEVARKCHPAFRLRGWLD